VTDETAHDGMLLAASGTEDTMNPHTPADLKNPNEYGRDQDEMGGSAPDSNFWEAEYHPTENIDDIPLTPRE
jgi:hypothetical protein